MKKLGVRSDSPSSRLTLWVQVPRFRIVWFKFCFSGVDAACFETRFEVAERREEGKKKWLKRRMGTCGSAKGYTIEQ